MEGHIDLVIGSNERSWSVDVPFDNFGQKHPTGSCQISQKIAVFIENIFIQKPCPFELGGGWGLLRLVWPVGSTRF